jgi:Zn-dependent peptidase ImmA (M78 family)
MNLKAVHGAAESVAMQYGKDRLPIDLDAIASTLELRILYAELPEDVSGLLVSGPDGNFVVVQKSDHPNRQRFTVGHEIGHHFLKHQFVPGEHVHVDRGHYVSQRGPRSSTGLDTKEIEANQFAAALLMPSRLVRQEVSRLGTAHLLDHHVSALAETFGVSEQAMTIRLSSLGVL